MDNLTHTLTGLFLSRAGLNRLTPCASAILMVAANAPDIDIVTLAGGPVAYLHYHRHLTHSLIAMPVMAILSVLLVRLISRTPVAWKGAFAISMIGVFSHLMWDYTNGYGIRLMLPFSDGYSRLEWNNVFDIWIWAALLLGVAAPYLGRLVGAEITSGAHREKYPSRAWPVFALGFVMLYSGVRAVLHQRALNLLASRVYSEDEPLREAAIPSMSNPFRWRGLVEAEDFFASVEVHALRGVNPAQAQVYHKFHPDPAVEAAAKKDEAFQVFLKFSEFTNWSVTPDDKLENGKIVTAEDMRYRGWTANAIEDSQNRVVRAWLEINRVPK
jgi:inner membrane protein